MVHDFTWPSISKPETWEAQLVFGYWIALVSCPSGVIRAALMSQLLMSTEMKNNKTAGSPFNQCISNCDYEKCLPFPPAQH